MSGAETLLAARAVSRRFGGLRAVDEVSLDLQRGVLHALDPNAAIELLIAKLKETRSNSEFLEAMRKNSR